LLRGRSFRKGSESRDLLRTLAHETTGLGHGMDIHEYQAKELFRKAGIPVPPGEVATAPDEAEAIARKLGGTVVVKAQVHAGGRGKAGGVKLAASPEEARSHASDILGMTIKGLTVGRVLVTPAEEIASEAYVGVLVDRSRQAPVFMVSPEGGVDIEEVAATTPEAIKKVRVDPRYGLLPHQAYGMATFLYDDPGLVKQTTKIIGQLYRAFSDNACSLAEINPLIVTPEGDVKAIDAKVSVDDSALFRLPEVEAYRDLEAEPTSETKAREAGLSFVKLDGNVGCCVNGAGLAMATMDLVKYYGGEPANFLDIGGSSNPDKVVAALEIITSDPNVKAILFNIFGGITRCDDVANGILEATRRIDIQPPIVIRLTGTNEKEALEILDGAGFSATTSMDEVVEKAVELAGQA
jgi:succinyl-CoA synthetase beta subunit